MNASALFRESSDAAGSAADLTQRLREQFAGLDDTTRRSVIAECAQAATALSRDHSQRLCQIREALRPRWPSNEDPSAARSLRCEGIVSAGEDCFAVWGWAVDRHTPDILLIAISPEGVRIELDSQVAWHVHPLADAARSRTAAQSRSGFFCRFTAPPSPAQKGWLVEMHSPAGAVLESRAPVLLTEPEVVSQALLERLALGGDQLIARQHACRLAASCRGRWRDDRVERDGDVGHLGTVDQRCDRRQQAAGRADLESGFVRRPRCTVETPEQLEGPVDEVDPHGLRHGTSVSTPRTLLSRRGERSPLIRTHVRLI